MDFRTQQVIAELTRNIARLEERLERTERAAGTPQLPNASLTNAAIRMVDADGTDRGSIGWQTDGTVAIVPSNGPPPPKPSTPGVAAAQLSLAIAWDGLFAEGDDGDPATQPKDFDHVQVHLSTTSGYTPDAVTLQGSLSKPGSVVITPLSDENTYYAVLVPVNTSGITGEASDPTAGTPDPVVSGEVLDGSITTLKLADDAVTNAKIADTAVDANKLADGSVSAQKILDDAITASKIDDGAVTAAALGPDAVTAGKLADGSIDASTLFTGGVVDTTAIGSGAVTTGKIAAGTIVAGNISAGAIGTTELAANSVVAGKIAANAVTAGKINAGAVTATEIAADTITASQIAVGAIGASELAANSIIAGKIAAGVVDATALAAQAVTTAKLAALAVTANELAANAVTAGKINAGAVTAGTIAAGAVTASKLEATMVVATVMQSTGYVAGVSGWKIDGSGSVELNNAVARGTIDVGPTAAPYARAHIDSKTISGESAGVISFPTSNSGEFSPAQMYYSRASRTTVLQGSQHTGHLNQQPMIVMADSDTPSGNTFEVFVGPKSVIYANSDIGAHLSNQVYDQTAFSGGANTPTSQSISGYGCTGQNHIGFASANTTVVGTVVLGVAVSSVTATSIIVWVCRTNTTSTTINYCIIGRT